MLSPHDAQIVRDDSEVVGLRILLDDDALAEFAAHFLSLSDVAEARCDYVRYKPKQKCLARFQVFDSNGGTTDFYAIAYRGIHCTKINKAQQSIITPTLSMVACRFPIDLELKSLTRFSSDAGLRHLLVRMGCAEMAAGQLLQRRLRYKPERRYVARIESPTGAATLKMYSPEIFRAAYDAAKSLRSAAGLPIVRRLARSQRHHAILFDWQPGVTLSSLLECGLLPADVICRVGETLAGLHSSGVGNLVVCSPQEDADSLIAVTDDLGRIIPRLADQAQRLAARIAEQIANVKSPRWAIIHGDFSAEQIVIKDSQPFFIDLDRASHSIAAKDIGNFVGHLEMDTLYEKYSDRTRDQATTALVDGYRAAGGTIDPREIDLHTAASLLRLALEPFRNRLSNWHEHVVRIVLRAQEITDGPRQSVPHRTRPAIAPRLSVEDDIIDVQSDMAMPFLKQAMAFQLVKQRLAEVLCNDGELQSFELSSIRTLRYKQGRRCLIEYHGRLPDSGRQATILGKVHAKERHEQALFRQQMLWNSGFDSNCTDGICVARPLGAIPEWHMWLQCAVAGQVSWYGLVGPRAISIAIRIAQAAHKLHRANIPTKQTHMLDDELALLSERLPRVAHELPKFRERIQRILDQCHELAKEIVPVLPVGIHRDFYPDQVLVDGERLFVVDHDLYARGDPRLDIGNFCGHLIERSIRIEQHPNAYDRPALAMIDRFIELHGDDQPCRHAIYIYTVLTLARHVCLSRQIVERKMTTLPLVELLEQLTCAAPFAYKRTTCRTLLESLR